MIVAEGATDRVRRPIESQYLRTILSDRLGHDTRVTCLGHVQRGGEASADDRVQVSCCMLDRLCGYERLELFRLELFRVSACDTNWAYSRHSNFNESRDVQEPNYMSVVIRSQPKSTRSGRR